MTAPVFVNAGTTANQNFGTSITPALPGSRTNGNLLIAFVTGSATGAVDTFSFGAGWTSIDSIASANANGAMAYRYVDGTETAPSITWGSNDSAAAVVLQYTNVVSSSPIGAKHNTGPTATQATSTDTGITMQRGTSTAMAVTLGDTGTQAVTSGPGGSWSQDFINTTGSGQIAVYSNTTFGSGSATGSWSVTWTNTRHWDGFTFELASQAAVTEVDITASPAMGFSEAATVSVEAELTASPGMGFSEAATVQLEQDLTASMAFGFSQFTSFDDAQFLTAAVDMGFGMAAGLIAENDQAAAPAMGFAVAATVSLERDLSASLALGFAQAASLRRKRRMPVVCVVS